MNMKKMLMTLTLLMVFSTNAKTVELAGSEVNFNLITSQNVEIEKAVFGIRCLRSATFFEQFNNGLKDHMPCDDFKINGKSVVFRSQSITLLPDASGKYELPNVRVDYRRRRKGHVCFTLSVKIKDQPFIHYKNEYDRYSLHSFCNVREIPDFTPNQYVFDNKRAEALDEFSGMLKTGIDVILKE